MICTTDANVSAVPVDPVAALPVILIACIGVAAAAIGLTAFERRDLVSGDAAQSATRAESP